MVMQCHVHTECNKTHEANLKTIFSIRCKVVNGPTILGQNPTQTRKYRSEPENYFETQIMPEKARKLS